MVQQEKEKALIRVKVLPRSSKNEVCGMGGDVLKVKLTAPAVEGKANKALIALLSDKFGIAKSHIFITSGQNARTKTIQIEGHDPEMLKALKRPDS